MVVPDPCPGGRESVVGTIVVGMVTVVGTITVDGAILEDVAGKSYNGIMVTVVAVASRLNALVQHPVAIPTMQQKFPPGQAIMASQELGETMRELVLYSTKGRGHLGFGITIGTCPSAVWAAPCQQSASRIQFDKHWRRTGFIGAAAPNIGIASCHLAVWPSAQFV